MAPLDIAKTSIAQDLPRQNECPGRTALPGLGPPGLGPRQSAARTSAAGAGPGRQDCRDRLWRRSGSGLPGWEL